MKKETNFDLSKILKGSFLSYAVKGIGTLSTIGLTVYLARSLSPHDFGIYSLLISMATLLAIIAKLGLPQILVREISANLQRKNLGLVSSVVKWALIKYLKVSVFLILAWLIMSHFLSGVLWSNEYYPWLYLAILFFPFISLNQILSGGVQGFGEPWAAQYPEKIVKPTLALILVVTVAELYGQLSIDTVITVTLFSSFIALVIVARRLRMKVKFLPPAKHEQAEEKKWKRALLPFALIAGMVGINKQLDIIMISFFMTPENVAQYKIAAQAGLLMMFSYSAVQLVIAPYVSRYYVARERKKLKKLLRFSAWLALLSALPLMLIIYIWGEKILIMLFGGEYGVSYDPLIIIGSGYILMLFFGHAPLALNMCNGERLTQRILAFCIVINAALNLILIPILGLVGAALATASSQVLSGFMSAYFFRRKEKISTSIFGF